MVCDILTEVLNIALNTIEKTAAKTRFPQNQQLRTFSAVKPVSKFVLSKLDRKRPRLLLNY